MFDTSVVRARAIAAPRSATLAASIALHSIAVVAAIALSVSSTRLPADPPRQFELYRPVAEPPQPPPPPLGHPAAEHRAQPSAQPPAAHAETTAPQSLPDEVRVVPPSTASQSLTPAEATDVAATDAIGDPHGVDGGVRGGQPGGTGTGEGEAHGPYQAGIGGVTLPRTILRVEPKFPELMRHAVDSAIVVVRCVIGTDGRVHDPEIVMSSFPPFNDSVLEALLQWKFEPGMMRGRPVDTYFELKVRFEVHR